MGREILEFHSPLNTGNSKCYVFTESARRIDKERAIRRRQMRWLIRRLREVSQMKTLTRESLLMKLGAAKQKTPLAWRLFEIAVAESAPTFAIRPSSGGFTCN